jgi:putative membrane protein
MPMMWGYYTDNTTMTVWMIVQSVFWFLLVAFAVWAFVRWLNRPSRSATPLNTSTGQSALEILKQRYARGEIDAATFADMRARLEDSEQPSGQNRELLSNGANS